MDAPLTRLPFKEFVLISPEIRLNVTLSQAVSLQQEALGWERDEVTSTVLSWTIDTRRPMLVLLWFILWGWRTVMFQLFGFYFAVCLPNIPSKSLMTK